jgi:hypothetical protein
MIGLAFNEPGTALVDGESSHAVQSFRNSLYLRPVAAYAYNRNAAGSAFGRSQNIGADYLQTVWSSKRP